MIKLEVKTGKEILHKIYDIAQELKIDVFAVGGFVRDLILGKEGTDLDFVVIGDAIEFAHRFRKRFRSSKVVVYPKFGTAMVHYNNFKLEFVTAREERYQPHSRKPDVTKADLKSDLSRRDFTINCLAMDISAERFGEVFDEFEGVEDIRRRIIRTPLDPFLTFDDDPLRILRAIRFAAQLEFQIEPRSYDAIVQTKERLKIVSQERITEEFRKTLLAPKPSIGLDLMKQTGILAIFLPEVEQLSGIEQREGYHHKDVFYHTLEVLDNISTKTDKFELRLAALFHDIAKPQTKRFTEGIGWTFHGHEDLGARMMDRIGRRLKLPVQIIKYVQKLIQLHLRPIALADEEVTDSAYRRLMVEAGDQIDDLLILCRADITSKNPAKVRQYLSNFDRVEKRIREVEEKDRLRQFKPALSGDDIMKILDIPPGPLVGKLKQAVVDAILDGEIPNEYHACYNYLLKIKDKYLTEFSQSGK